jgi:hypothetical protein
MRNIEGLDKKAKKEFDRIEIFKKIKFECDT